MDNGNESAYPLTEDSPKFGPRTWLGLTKREYFAAMAMQGIVASCNSRGVLMDTEIAPFAVKWADALIAALKAFKPDILT